jgi:L-arabinose isomerase
VIPSLKQSEIWFVTGSQHLYGPQTLEQVAENSRKVADALDGSPRIPCRVVFKPVVKTPDEISALLAEANVAKGCIGLVSGCTPSRRPRCGSSGLASLQKPYLHLHTQFNRDLPWSTRSTWTS